MLIVDFHNIESVLYGEILGHATGAGDWCRAVVLRWLASRAERACIQSASRLWVCSKDDAVRCRTAYPDAPVISIVPNGIDTTRYIIQPMPSSAPYSLVFCANFAYFPNAQAAAFAIEQIFPRIRAAVPGVTLTFVGRSPTRGMLRAAQSDRAIRVTGSVPDVRPFLRTASVAIIPVFIGGGTRLKVLEAMAIGCPVVSTSKGAEGLDVLHDRELLIANDPDAFVSAVLRVCTDHALRHRLCAAAQQLVRQTYSWSAISALIESALPPCSAD